MHIKPSFLCDHCRVPDYFEHFFIECMLVRDFWRYINNHIKSVTNINIKLNTNNILLGLVYTNFRHIKKHIVDYINYIILIGKLCISKFRYGKINNLYLIFEIEMSLRKESKYNSLR